MVTRFPGFRIVSNTKRAAIKFLDGEEFTAPVLQGGPVEEGVLCGCVCRQGQVLEQTGGSQECTDFERSAVALSDRCSVSGGTLHLC